MFVERDAGDGTSVTREGQVLVHRGPESVALDGHDEHLQGIAGTHFVHDADGGHAQRAGRILRRGATARRVTYGAALVVPGRVDAVDDGAGGQFDGPRHDGLGEPRRHLLRREPFVTGHEPGYREHLLQAVDTGVALLAWTQRDGRPRDGQGAHHTHDRREDHGVERRVLLHLSHDARPGAGCSPARPHGR